LLKLHTTIDILRYPVITLCNKYQGCFVHLAS